jgi:hypothetical protein
MKPVVNTEIISWYLECVTCGAKTTREATQETLLEKNPNWVKKNGGWECPQCQRRREVFKNIKMDTYSEFPFDQGTWYLVENDEQGFVLDLKYGDDFFSKHVGGWVCVAEEYDGYYERTLFHYYTIEQVKVSIVEFITTFGIDKDTLVKPKSIWDDDYLEEE